MVLQGRRCNSYARWSARSSQDMFFALICTKKSHNPPEYISSWHLPHSIDRRSGLCRTSRWYAPTIRTRDIYFSSNLRHFSMIQWSNTCSTDSNLASCRTGGFWILPLIFCVGGLDGSFVTNWMQARGMSSNNTVLSSCTVVRTYRNNEDTRVTRGFCGINSKKHQVFFRTKATSPVLFLD